MSRNESSRRNTTRKITRTTKQSAGRAVASKIDAIAKRSDTQELVANIRSRAENARRETTPVRPLVARPPRSRRRPSAKPSNFVLERHGNFVFQRAPSKAAYMKHTNSVFAKKTVKDLASSYRSNVPVVSEHVIHSLPATYHEEGVGVNARCRLHAVELLSAVELDPVYDAENAGNELLTIPLNPRYFSNTRALMESRSWVEWKLHRAKFIYVPSVAATASGNLVMFVEQTASNPLITHGETAVRYALSNPSVLFQTWNEAILEYKDGDLVTNHDYVANKADPLMSVEGVFHMITGSDVVAADVAGMVLIEYDIEFSQPTLDISLSSYATQRLYGDLSFTSYSPIKGDPFLFASGGSHPQYSISSGWIPTEGGVYYFAGHIVGTGANPTLPNNLIPLGEEEQISVPELTSDEVLPVYGVLSVVDTYAYLVFGSTLEFCYHFAKSSPGTNWETEGVLGTLTYAGSSSGSWTGAFHGSIFMV